MPEPCVSGQTIGRLILIGCLSAFTFGTVFYGRTAEASYAAAASAQPSPTPPRRRVPARRATARSPKKYSDFPHSAKAHQIECSLCHKFPSANWNKVRSESEAFPDITDYPKHESCLGCHKQQFFKGRPPVICSICHTGPGPAGGTRHPFPNPREIFDKSPKGQKAPDTDFAISFPHDKHIDIVTGITVRSSVFQNASYTKSKRAEESCSVCHKTYKPAGDSPDEYVTKPPANLGDSFWLKKGTFKTTPIGHTVCFTCHSVDSGIEPTPVNCGTCHTPKPAPPQSDLDPKLPSLLGITDKIMLTQWRRRDSSATFRHEFSMHADMECATCHTVASIVTLDPATKKVPIASCATCHATPTSADGGVLNYEIDQRNANSRFQCVKCHIAFGKRAIPDSHLKALAAARGD